MKVARIPVLAVALAAGGAAAFLIGSDEEKRPEAPHVAQIALRSLLDAGKVSEEEGRNPDINTVLFGVSNK